jgi:hypothetical protein
MKAALRVIAACVNVMLFLLSSSNLARLLILVTTLGAWWWLSDYYFAQRGSFLVWRSPARAPARSVLRCLFREGIQHAARNR